MKVFRKQKYYAWCEENNAEVITPSWAEDVDGMTEEEVHKNGYGLCDDWCDEIDDPVEQTELEHVILQDLYNKVGEINIIHLHEILNEIIDFINNNKKKETK